MFHENFLDNFHKSFGIYQLHHNRYLADLAQGGLEVPCTYTLKTADKEWVQKVRKCLEQDGAQVNDKKI